MAKRIDDAVSATEAQPAKPKPRRRWLQYSLRTLLLFTIIVSLGASWFALKVQRAREQRAAVEAIWALDGDVMFDTDMSEAEPSAGREWLCRLLGEDLFRTVEEVWLGGTEDTDSALAHLNGMVQPIELELSSSQATDTGLAHLKGMTRLSRLDLSDTSITDAGLVHLEAMTCLQHLDLSGTQVTDAGLVHLEGMARLQHLDLAWTQVTDAGYRFDSLGICYGHVIAKVLQNGLASRAGRSRRTDTILRGAN